MKRRRGQSDQITLIIIAGGALILLGLALWIFWPKSNTKPLDIGGVVVTEIPKNAVVEWKDATVAERLKQLKEQGMLRVFIGSTLGGSTLQSETLYNVAAMDAREKVSKYISTVMKTFEQRAVGALSNVVTGDETKVQTLTTEVYKSVSKAMSKMTVMGSKVIAKYYVKADGGYKFYVVMLFDPEGALQAIQATAQLKDEISALAKKYGAQSKAVFEAINDVFKEAVKDTPLEEKK